MGGENFHEGGAGFSNIIINKKKLKDKYEKKISTESNEQH